MLSFQTSVANLIADPFGRILLGSQQDTELRRLAYAIGQDDPYDTMERLSGALRLCGAANGVDGYDVLEHQIWCAWRTALWQTGKLEVADVEGTLQVEGVQWLHETRDHPTVLVSPMTLSTHDVASILTLFSNTEDRAFVVFGEDMKNDCPQIPDFARRVVSGGLDGMREIARILSVNGAFCTYPDFVYRGHLTLPVSLFGQVRPMSSSFAAIACQPGVMLLPSIALRDGRALRIKILEPLLMEDDETSPDMLQNEPYWKRSVVAQLVSTSLEGLIRIAPQQWLLINTLTHEAKQLAGLSVPRSADKS